jgi:HD-GYP domain-containing protein (c-di-GMP phosphodiesterase class II)
MMVYQHHERLDGNGYPVGVVESEIHPWSKICSVVDVYEALTSYRPYRSPMSRKTAFEIMERDIGKAFDPEVLGCWIQITNAVWAS